MHLQPLQTFKITKLTEPHLCPTLKHIGQFSNQLLFKEERLSSQKNNWMTDSQCTPNDTILPTSKTLRCSKKVVVKKIFLKAQKSQILPQLHLYLTWRKLDLLLEVISVLLNLYLTKFLILFLKFWEKKINVINLLFTFNRCKLLNYEVFRAGKPVFNLCHLT